MSRRAVIDLGTNTFHLLIAEKRDGKFMTILKKLLPVKLGEGGINKGFIAPVPYERGMKALREFHADIGRFGVGSVTAFATSAIRSASNGDEFIAQVRKETGIEITKIDGETEAELIFEGVKHSVELEKEKVLVMDIGGGSVEFIIGNAEGISWKKSYKIGAARLIEKFPSQDPMLPEEVKALEDYFSGELQSLKEAVEEHKVTTLVGSAGSFESIVDLIGEKKNEDLLAEDQTWCVIPIDEFESVYSRLLKSNTEERKKMRGLVSYRVEMMVVAAIMINFVLRNLGIRRMICSTFSLKEGILFNE